MTPPRRHAPARRAARGFTLVEVLVALGIMSMVMVVMYVTLYTSLQARDQLETEARVARLGPEILDILEADLRRAWVVDIEEDRVFRGESRNMDGEAADSLSFLTTVDSTVSRRIDDREVPSDVCETGYRLRRNPQIQDVMELWRRQSYHVDEKPLENGVYERLHDRVVSFQVRYLERLDRYAERLTDWDSATRHGLPAAVEIELALEAAPRTAADLQRRGDSARTLVYRRVVPMRLDSALAMRVHPLPPSFLAAGAGGPGGASGADGEEEGEDTDGDGVPDTFPDADSPGANGQGSGGQGGAGQGGGGQGDSNQGGGNQGGGNQGGGGSNPFQDALDELLAGLGGG